MRSFGALLAALLSSPYACQGEGRRSSFSSNRPSRKTKVGISVAVLAATLLSIAPLLAQQDIADSEEVNVVQEGDKKVIYKARTEISFEGVDVEGEIKKPSGSFLLDRKKSRFKSVIHFREDFDKEMMLSVLEIK